MAVELLCDYYWKDNTTSHYYHELEAFFWMLPFVFLAYDDGKLDPTNRFIKGWMTSDDHNTCRAENSDFALFQLSKARAMVKGGFKDHTYLMSYTCMLAQDMHFKIQSLCYLRKWQDPENLDPMASLQDGDFLSPSPHIRQSVDMWNEFVNVLTKMRIDTIRLEQHRPAFESAGNQDLFEEMKAMYDSFHRLPVQRRLDLS